MFPFDAKKQYQAGLSFLWAPLKEAIEKKSTVAVKESIQDSNQGQSPRQQYRWEQDHKYNAMVEEMEKNG